MKTDLNAQFDNIKCVFVDVDNTLLDFERSSQLAIIRTCEDLNIAYPDSIFDVFIRVNNEMWRDIQDGKMTKAELWLTRWNKIFAEVGMSADGPFFEAEFHRRLHDCAVPVEGAKDALEYLHSKYLVCTASNASLKQQTHRLRLAGMSEYIDKMFVSEQLGAQKPDTRFFEECFKQLDFLPGETLMIGDDLHADMLGASKFGLRTCWYNPKNLPNSENVHIDVEISSLDDIIKLNNI